MSDVINKVVPIEAIKSHPENYNMHPPDQIEDLEKSLGDLGQYRSVVLWEQSDGSYIQLAGHGVVEAMKSKGISEVRADVHPSSLDPMAAKRILIADNLHAQKSSPDETMLVQLLQEQQDAGFDLTALGTDDETLRQMLEALGDEYVGESERDEEEDELPEEVETRARIGDVWALGRHRLLVGDCTDMEAVKCLMQGESAVLGLHDPPYGLRSRMSWGFGDGKKWGNAKAPRGTFPPVTNDDQPFDPTHLLDSGSVVVIWGANHFSDKLPVSSAWIVWDKRVDLPSNDQSDGELAWVSTGNTVHIIHHRWNGMIRDSERGEKRVHPTQKSVEVTSEIIRMYTEENDCVVDWYAGSGTTLMACQKTKRVVRLCELEPHYADIILARYEAETNQTATLLHRIEEAEHV